MLSIEQVELFYPESLRPFKRNLMREYLQYKILAAIFNSKFADKLSFMGGTAIHIIHSIDRFSEDLDFDNFSLQKNEFEDLTKLIHRALRLEGYSCEVKNTFERAYRSSIKISNLLYENKLSRDKNEKLLIYFDTEPQKFTYTPNGAMINKFDVFAKINVVPVDILLSQKLYAIFMRKRAMGRDFYDAIFLFGKTKPNFDYLEIKLGVRNIQELKEKLLKISGKFDFKQLTKDVEPFLFRPGGASKILLFENYVRSLS